jgi:hypothetical protein
MSLEELARRVGTRMAALGKRLWPGDPRLECRDALERLGVDLNQQILRAVHSSKKVAELRARLAENEVREAMLASRIETYVHIRDQATAYRDALELDQVRRQLAEDRARLPDAEKSHRVHQARVATLEQRLTELEAKFVAASS